MAHEITEVKGVFHDRDSLEEAVYRLGQKSVPTDSISVLVTDPAHGTSRRVDVEPESGTLRGALFGAVGGGVLGLLVLLLVPAGLLGATPAELFEQSTVVFGLSVVAVLAFAGLRLGAVLGMGHWRSRRSISERDFRQGEVWVSVRSDELSDVADRVLRESGAERVIR